MCNGYDSQAYGELVAEVNGMRDASIDTTQHEHTEYAFVRLSRLCGCNYKQPIERRGVSVFVRHPQRRGVQFRMSAAKFDAGESHYADNWLISKWDTDSARITESERNWQGG